MRQLFFRDAGAKVTDADDDARRLMGNGRDDAFAIAAVLGRVVENVQKHLPHTRHVAGNLRNLAVGRLVFQCDTLLLEAAAVHEHRIFKLRQNVGFFDTQGKPAVLHSRKLQQLFDHAGKASGLTQDDKHAAPRLLGKRIV